MVASRIKHVSIRKIWGVKNISTDFHEHINIFIGSNGSSKTTFLNLIEAALICDINTFANIEFESIDIVFSNSCVNKLIIKKKHTEDFPVVTYIFDDGSEFEIICSEILFRSYNRAKYRDVYMDLKNKLSEIIKFSWLSINRDNISLSEIERSRDYMDKIRNMVDLKIQELTKNLLVYQLQLESEANKDSMKFKEEVLSLMLYNETFDNYNKDNIKRFENTDILSMQRDLFNAFKKLGIVKDKSEFIKKHIQKIREVISRLSNSTSISFEDVFILSLINRTISIIEISKEHEANTTNIFAPMESFWKCLESFMPNKRFLFNKTGNSDLVVELTEGNSEKQSIRLSSLSSGEKQLFILLSEALLQKKSAHLFIADEPELSLHIEWQRRILSTLLELNPNAQIIVATHSPEIAGNFPQNITNMKKITSYE